MEEWLQTEWPRPARLAHVGDRAVGDGRRRRARTRATLLARADGDPARQRRASRSWRSREGEVAGIPARVCRISFSGELAFEVNVDGRRGLELWEAIHGAGDGDAVRHRGDARAARREGLPDRRPGHRRHRHAAGPRHGLDRLEDEARLPRQALARARRHRAAPTASSSSACCRSTATTLLPEGAQLVDSTPGRAPMLGHVTSSYRSAALGRHVRARAARAAAASGSARPSTPTASRPRSRTRCSTTGRARAAMAVLT